MGTYDKINCCFLFVCLIVGLFVVVFCLFNCCFLFVCFLLFFFFVFFFLGGGGGKSTIFGGMLDILEGKQ